MPIQFEYLINLFAGVFLVTAQVIYILLIIRKKITPSLFTWLGWAILVGVGLISQLYEYGWSWVLIGHLFSALGCLFIALTAIITKNYQVLKQDYIYLVTGVICILLYITFKDPWSTTIFSIVADLILGIPTILKGYKNPRSEKSIGWNIALGCWGITLMTCMDENFIFVLFPLYCFLFNVTMSLLTTKKRVSFKELIPH